MKKLINLPILILILSTFVSCYQEGPPGPPGPPGINGTNGQDGSIPLVYYFDMELNMFQPQSYNSSWVAYGFIDNYTITDNDLVYVYAYLSSDGLGDNYWQALPFNEYMDNGDVFLQHSFGIMGIDYDNYLKGDIMFSMRKSDSSAPYQNMNSDAIISYKVIVVKGQEGKKATIPDSIDTKDIYKLMNYLKIKE